ncbi:protein STPG4-like [Mya arenaria]|uniref:protein STPG4-like n=1 Tax=Mya arenaria TaxID=6604 RepID=UPI0022E0D00E|nr:protein STPG4-like [Mya arenaria]
MKPRATMITTPSKAYSMPTRKHRAKTESSLTVQRHPWEGRKALSEEYEGELSGREGWWRTYIRETPIPGSYELEAQNWYYELERRPNTYRFKSDGRRIDPHPHGKGAMLLPGAYEHKDFLTRLERDPATYGFKTAERDKFDVLNFGRKDKDVNVAPNMYGVEKFLTLTVDKQPSKHSVFKSQSKRFPTEQFKPRDGPAPGNYEYQPELPPKVSSCFKSKTPRFSSSHTRVPGPGSYEKTFQTAQNGVLQKMGRQHGLFFSSAFQV